jgi:hypothetical protein
MHEINYLYFVNALTPKGLGQASEGDLPSYPDPFGVRAKPLKGAKATYSKRALIVIILVKR